MLRQPEPPRTASPLTIAAASAACDRAPHARGEVALRRARRDRRRGSPHDFDGQFAELRVIAIGSARRVLGDPGLSEEVAQEVLHRVFRHWDVVESYARPWTSRVATNLAIDRLRQQRAQCDDQLEIVEPDSADRIIERDELRHAFEQLTPKLRKTVELRIVHQLDPDEAAADLGCSRAAVLKNTTRGLKIMREALASSCS